MTKASPKQSLGKRKACMWGIDFLRFCSCGRSLWDAHFSSDGVYDGKDQPQKGDNGAGRRAQGSEKLTRKLAQGEVCRVGGVCVCARIEVILLSRLSRRKGREEQKKRNDTKDENIVAACVDVERRKIGLTEQTEQIVKRM